ncbi:MAG TPA: hypothetical protein VNH21_13595 [Steroidobacteraceae bacterium]|nr:hypothetical protein [Steroidobacteraceae bacterium]
MARKAAVRIRKVARSATAAYIHATIPLPTHAEVKALAQSERRSFSQMVALLIQDGLDVRPRAVRKLRDAAD